MKKLNKFITKKEKEILIITGVLLLSSFIPPYLVGVLGGALIGSVLINRAVNKNKEK